MGFGNVLKKIGIGALVLVVLAAVLLFAGRVYLQKHPQSYAMISHKIMDISHDLSKDYDISFKDPIISFDTQLSNIKIILPDVKIKTHKGDLDVKVKQVELYPNILNLLFGRVYLDSLVLDNPEISVSNLAEIVEGEGRGAGVGLKKIEMNNLVLTESGGKEQHIEYLRLNFQNHIIKTAFEIYLHNQDEEMKGKANINSLTKILEFDMNGKNLNFHTLFPKILDINLIADFEARGEFDYKNQKMNYIKFNKFDSQIGEHGKIDVEGEIDAEKIVKVKLVMSEIDINQLYKIWPSNIMPDIREWTIGRTAKAKIHKGAFDINITKNKENWETNKENIKGSAIFSDLSYNYEEKLPALKDAVGSFAVSHNSINIKLDKAKLHNSSVADAIVDIDYHKGVTITAKASGDLESVVQYIPHNVEKSLREVNLFLGQAEGDAATDINIFVPYKDDFEFNDIEFDINSKFKKFKIENLPGNMTLTDGSFDVALKDHKLNIKGNGYIGGKKTDINFDSSFEDVENVKNNLLIHVNLPFEVAQNIRLFNEDIVKSGLVDLKITYIDEGAKNNLRLNVDLTQAAVKIEKFGFIKDEGKELKLQLNAVKGKKILALSNIKLIGEDVDVSGNAKLNSDSLAPIYIKLNHVKFGKNNFAMEYDEKQNAKIYGEAIDLANANFSKFARGNALNQDKATFNVNLDKAYMKNGIVFDKVKGSLECDIKGCFKGELNAFSGEDMSKLALINSSSLYSDLILSSDDAASVLRAFNIYTKIRGGRLHLKGKKNVIHSKSNPEIIADVSITKFGAIKNNILAKILTVSSLPGIMHLLSKNEIPFDKFHANIIYNNGVLKLDQGVVEGGQLGLTIEGNVDMMHDRLDLKGTVIPDLYFINKAISSIPLLGKMLQGGGNKGVFAANYSIEGPYDKASTTVNPLSILTPGFTREVFGIFDVKKDKEE